jgi:hypothetical protein
MSTWSGFSGTVKSALPRLHTRTSVLRWLLADVAILGVSHRLPGLVLKIDCFSLVIGQSWLPAAEGLAGVEHGLMRVVQ